MERHARCRHLNHRNVLARRLGPLEIHHARGEVAQLATLGDLDARLRDHLTYRVLLAELKNGEQSYELRVRVVGYDRCETNSRTTARSSNRPFNLSCVYGVHF